MELCITYSVSATIFTQSLSCLLLTLLIIQLTMFVCPISLVIAQMHTTLYTEIISVTCFNTGVLASEGWWGMATLPQGNHELLVVRDKVGRPPGELGVSKSMECDIIPSMLWHYWLGDRKGIRPVKNWMLVCWWWWFDWSFARLIAPVVTITCIILCFNKHWLTQVHLEKWSLKRRQRTCFNIFNAKCESD